MEAFAVVIISVTEPNKAPDLKYVQWSEIAVGNVNPPAFSSMITYLQEKYDYHVKTNFALVDILYMTKEQYLKYL